MWFLKISSKLVSWCNLFYLLFLKISHFYFLTFFFLIIFVFVTRHQLSFKVKYSWFIYTIFVLGVPHSDSIFLWNIYHLKVLKIMAILPLPYTITLELVCFTPRGLYPYSHTSILSVHLQPSSPHGWPSFSESVSSFLFHRYVHWCHILDPTYKSYHMIFVFAFMIYFT